MMSNEKRARVVRAGAQIEPSEAADLLGEFSALLRQLGSPLIPLGAGGLGQGESIKEFLEAYLANALLPVELPAIAEACEHTRRGELRELIAQDQRLAEPLERTPFAGPSAQVGRLQLARLRPLRDERMVQRYLAAVDRREARGWHTLVYGMTLAVYSLPLRQGLLYYAQETLLALAGAAGRSKNMTEADLGVMLETLMARVPEAAAAALAQCPA
ncbi:MAG: urease accessory UreF family protein [Verrucomicrobiota bacterium]|jgi:urease accessory protein UreF